VYSLDGATGWLNSPPLTADELLGRVVLVDFWTYTCINWLRTLPYLQAWTQAYEPHGLVVAGVHTPEFDFEHDPDNVHRAVRRLRVDFPVALDSDHAVWRAFDNHYWPALYLVDAHGRIRHHQFGEGDYERIELLVRQLLVEAGAADLGGPAAPVEADGVQAPADWDDLWSPENYLGYDRTQNFASRNGPVLGVPHVYAGPERLRLNQWAVAGEWTIEPAAIVLNAAGGRIADRFHARDLHLVMAPPPGATVRFDIRLDGRPPGAAHGDDVDEAGTGTVTEPRLHQLIRQPGPIGERTFQITFHDPGLRAYALTFG
jgi:thiol-disulfide isomerase/thioredoxin